MLQYLEIRLFTLRIKFILENSKNDPSPTTENHLKSNKVGNKEIDDNIRYGKIIFSLKIYLK